MNKTWDRATEDESRSPWEEKGRDLDRILALSDGVFGFALTLLATGIDLPALSSEVASTQFNREILSLVPEFFVYAFTFYFVIIKWMVHRRMFRVITHYDSMLIWLNNAFLLFIAFMPVPSKILVDHPTQTSAVVFFAVTHILTTTVQEAMFVYVTRNHRLVEPSLDPEWIRHYSLRNLAQIAVMILSIGIAIFNPLAAIMSWLLAFGVNIFVARRVRMRRHLRQPAARDHEAGA